VVRWTLTSKYAAKIESDHVERLKRDEDSLGPELTLGVRAWDRDTRLQPSHDYFLRLSDGETCIWEGFVPMVPIDEWLCRGWWYRNQYGLDLGTLWEEEGFGWYKEVKNILESHPAFRTYQKINRLKRQGNSIMDQTVDNDVELSRDLDKLMCSVFENQRFTFVAVERERSYWRQFSPKVLVTTKGLAYGGSTRDPFCHMTEQCVDPTYYCYMTTLTASFLPESFFFKFDYDLIQWEDDIFAQEEERIKQSNAQEEERIEKSNAQEEELIEKSNAQEAEQSHDDSEIVAPPKRALTVWYKDRAKKKQARKNPGMRRKKQKPGKKNMRRETKRVELIAFGMMY
jgi:hypothetical protein